MPETDTQPIEEHIDTTQVKRFFDHTLTTFLSMWVPAIVVLVPLMVFSFGYGVDTLRMALLFVMVLVGWIAWLIRATLIRGRIQWYTSTITWVVTLLMLVAFIASAVIAEPLVTWGWTGIFYTSGPYLWFGVLAFSTLVIQYVQGSAQRIQLLLALYLATSTLLALFISVVWIWSGTLPLVFGGNIITNAVWFGLNTTVLFGFWHGQKGLVRSIWLGALVIHMLTLVFIDATAVWYLLLGTLIVWTLLFALRERVLGKANYIAPLAIIGISIILLFVSLHSLWARFSFDSNTIQTVTTSVSMPRYIEHMVPQHALFGAGAGRSVEQFWELTELVDMRSVQSFPLLSNGYFVMLWEYGALFVLLFVAFLLTILISAGKLAKQVLSRKIPEQFQLFVYVYLALLIGVITWAIVFAAIPFGFIFLFSLALLASLLVSSVSALKNASDPRRAIKKWEMQTTAEQVFMKGTVVIAIGVVVVFLSVFSARLNARLSFFGAIENNASGTSIDLGTVQRVIDAHPSPEAFRFARARFYQSAVEQSAQGEPIDSAERVKPHLLPLSRDIVTLNTNTLSGAQYWQLGFLAEYVGTVTEQLGPFFITEQIGEQERPEEQDPTYWYNLAQAGYRQAVEKLPRNVILFTDVARFYRERAPALVTRNKDTSVERYYKIGSDLTVKARSIDDSYTPIYFEQAEQLLLQDQAAQAFELIKPHIGEDAASNYMGARVALAAGNVEEAIVYLESTIEKNENHLQARYDLVQTYYAQGDQVSALEQITELENRIPETDYRSRILITSLRQLVEGEQ